MIVRHAVSSDARAIAAIHVASWRAAYQGIVPAAHLSSLSVDERERNWHRILEQRASDTWVGEGDGQDTVPRVPRVPRVLGWISAAQSRDAGVSRSTGEIWGLYVDPLHWRRGVGRALWQNAEEHLSRSGFSDITLWVLKDNVRARASYESFGMVVEPQSEKTITIGGTELPEIRMRKTLG